MVKGSSFLARAFRADDESTAKDHLEAVRRRYHDATHHCWALRLVPRSDRPADPDPSVWVPEIPLERWDDDGEPSGTAGQPILGALRHAEVSDAVIVVTRYFGGTKLGTGGLGRAYGDAARAALEAAGLRIVWRLARIRVSCGFETVGAVEATLARAGASVRRVDRSFSPEPVYAIEIVRSEAARLCAQLIEASSGRARPVITGLNLSDFG
jgi:putative IMPACT (imprinted ancient) family translation regulator